MFQSLRARQPGKSPARILWWYLLSLPCYFWVGLCYRLRVWGARNVPRHGPVLLVSNHQSFLDPIIVGLGCGHRQFCSMARATLFDRPVFSWLIRSINAIPVSQGRADKGAMRRCLEALAQNQTLLVFAEGARTLDGNTHRFASGTMLLIKRSRPQVVPVAIQGAFKAWPRTKRLPRLSGRIHVRFGQAIAPDELISMGAEAALTLLHDRVERMRTELSDRMYSSKSAGWPVELSRRAL